jgi:hypothetical protein
MPAKAAIRFGRATQGWRHLGNVSDFSALRAIRPDSYGPRRVKTLLLASLPPNRSKRALQAFVPSFLVEQADLFDKQD